MKYADAAQLLEEASFLALKGIDHEAIKRLCLQFGREYTEYFLKVAGAVLPYSDREYDSAYDAIVEAGEQDVVVILPTIDKLLDKEWVVPYYNADQEKDKTPYMPEQLKQFAIEKKLGNWKGSYEKVVCKNYLEAKEKYKELSKRYRELNNLGEDE